MKVRNLGNVRRAITDPERIADQKKARRKARSQMKNVRIGVYGGKRTPEAEKVRRADVLGIIAIEMNDVNLKIKKCLLAKVTIGKNGGYRAGLCLPENLKLYGFSEEWNINSGVHVKMLRYASSKGRDEQVRIASDALRWNLEQEAAQAKLFDGVAKVAVDAFNKRPELQKETPDPFEIPAKKTFPDLHSLWIDGRHIEGTIETLREVLKK